MKRYDLEYFQAQRMVEQPDGEWVYYDDAQAEIEAWKARAEQAEAVCAEVRAYIERLRAALKKARGE